VREGEEGGARHIDEIWGGRARRGGLWRLLREDGGGGFKAGLREELGFDVCYIVGGGCWVDS
jgi:hypothetical protein